jgi:DNA-binding beta-propeller fold protein YncE
MSGLAHSKKGTRMSKAPNRLTSLWTGLSAMLVVCALGLAFASSASASFEEVGEFGGVNSGPGSMSYEANGVAVDDATGDVYVADGVGNRVLKYDAQGNFLEAWGWGVAADENPEIDVAKEFNRCGVGGEPAHPTCNELSGLGGHAGVPHYEDPGELVEPRGVAVDQATGDVYVLNEGRKHGAIQVFSPDGEYVGAFGQQTEQYEPISASDPELFYPTNVRGAAIAVGPAGEVYVVDARLKPEEERVLVFEPAMLGDYGDYVYAGRSRDIASGLTPSGVAVDAAGDVYVLEHKEYLVRLAAGDLSAPACRSAKLSGVTALAVDPVGGNAFVYEEKGNRVVEFNSGCELVEDIPVNSKVIESEGLAFSPITVAGAGRPAGTLYATAEFFEQPRLVGLILAGAVESIAPSVVSESVDAVGSTTVSLGAVIDPGGYETRYSFQYGLEACSVGGCSEAPVGGGVLGSGDKNLSAAVSLSGLSPDSTYHYRVLASSHCDPAVPSEECPAEGVEGTFTTYAESAPGLSDGRVYELVSPAFTDGGEVVPDEPDQDKAEGASCRDCEPGLEFEATPRQSAPDGDAVAYAGEPFAASGDAAIENEYLSTRTATGWQTRDLTPERESQNGPLDGYLAFSANLSAGVLAQAEPSLSPEAPEGYDDLYGQQTASLALSPLLTEAQLASVAHHRSAHEFNLQFGGASEDLTHVIFEANDALTAQTGFAPAAVDGGAGENNLYESLDGQLRLVNVLPGNAISEAGAEFGSGIELKGANRAFEPPDFDHAISADGSRIYWTDQNTGHVYVRVNAQSTVEVPDPGKFVTASADGSRVLLNDGRLYELDEGEGSFQEVTDLSEGQGGFQIFAGASENLATVYFIDTKALPGAEANAEGQYPKEGASNLYVWSKGVSRFIAISGAGTAQVTADGRYFAFNSVTGEPVQEVFEYDESTASLVCVSCNRSGVRPLGGSYLSVLKLGTRYIAGPRYLADNGRLFFNSDDSLTPYAINGGIEDVYEYEPEGIGTCVQPGGCVSLISPGEATTDSTLLTIDEEGNNAFFVTRERLVPEDDDDLVKLYDARVQGGFPAVTPPLCTGTGCQGTPGSPPIFATPSSVTFAGIGNFPPPPAPKKVTKKTVKCRSGLVKAKNNRCVGKKSKSKAKKAKRANRERRGDS